MKSISYNEGLVSRLKNSKYAFKLLKYAFEESCENDNWEAFGIVLQDIIMAHGSITEFANKTGVSRSHLYRMFGKSSNPTIKTLLPVLSGLGIKLTLFSDKETNKKVA